MADITEKWLKKNDPFFGKKCKNRYSYASNGMMDYRQRMEIPVSNVFSNRVRMDFDLDGEYRD